LTGAASAGVAAPPSTVKAATADANLILSLPSGYGASADGLVLFSEVVRIKATSGVAAI